MIWYKTGSVWEGLIVAVDVERETESSVWIGGRRCAKRSGWYNYFTTWTEARDFLAQRAADDLASAQRRLAQCEGRAADITALEEP